MSNLKRPLTPTETTDKVAKKTRISKTFAPNKIATAEAAAAVDANLPLAQLNDVMEKTVKKPQKGDSVVYWMRLADLRIHDNRALSRASEYATKQDIPLIALFVLSPQDYIAHDRSARRVDFTLRNLVILKESLSKLKIPLHVTSHSPRRNIPSFVLGWCETYGARALFANIEYEVDELRRDIQTCKLAIPKGIQVNLFHNKCVIEPGVLFTKQGKAYAVYSPYQRNWIATLNANLPYYLEECPMPTGNAGSVRSSEKFASLFDSPIPETVEGFELEDGDRRKMCEVHPAGEEVAGKLLDVFLHTKSRSSQLGAVNPLADGSQKANAQTRILNYGKDRDRVDKDTTSRLSVYLSSGVLSVRECVRATMRMQKSKKVDGGRDTGIGRWVQEIAWRDFYTNIVASFPRVSMGRPYLEKFASVVWENHQAPQESGTGRRGQDSDDAEVVKRWKDGKTGVPIVDATMRCINEMGWVHNRVRMITAMYLTKDLMIDWRVGERYFMQKLIDGDLASNNGGWQWSASTGVDPCPYFRIFNPHTQSGKADPTGEFIRHWVPELRPLRGPDLHNPSESAANKLGYPLPMVIHSEARERALRRYGNPGEE
ncbi:DNA photolyase, FAD-binding/Cryptochrome [Crepidotus variabilis]|uniref:DNA photolyase, FAD-binding/Cryptochrome n=1 Tax=Crepidotus variabilis TaxID=179855 RepID=A0A9P6ET75_9AGAR|nr:DNA photolyase, FAD-binding/Cryptochrome [Crepidotus variabilis]